MANVWEGLARGIEKAGERWSGSIMRELEQKKAEERERRMFSWKMGEEEKAGERLMKLQNKYSIELERGKAALSSELSMYLGSPQLQSIMTEALESGRPEFQLQALGTRDLISRVQRFEKTTPQDIKMLQSLPQTAQAPIALAMGRLKQYHDKQEMEERDFQLKKQGIDADIKYKKALTEALQEKASGVMSPEAAQALLDSSTKALATLYKDENFRGLLKMVSQGGEESLSKDRQIAWRDYMERYSFLRGSIAGAKRVLGIPTEGPEKEPEPPLPEGEDFFTMLENTTAVEMARTGIGEAGRFIYELLEKGYSTVAPTFKKNFMLWFKGLLKTEELVKKE